MECVKTLDDIERLRSRGEISEEVLDYLENYFRDLAAPLGGEQEAEQFSLEDHGYFVLLEGDCDLRQGNLEEVGLTRDFMETAYEFIEEVELEGGLLYKVSVLYTNDYMMQFFLRPDDFGPEVREWLERNAVTIKDYIEEDLEVPF